MPKDYIISFSTEKNASLKAQRGISFEDIAYCLENDYLLDTIDHVSSKYPHQKMFVVELNQYVYLVPFVQRGKEVFLKTVYPSRRMTKRYLEKNNEEK